MTSSEEDQALVVARRVASRLIAIPGVAAVALGGSRARGTATLESDVDLGIYYHADRRPSLDALRDLAEEIDDEHRRDAVTAFGAWGKWVNGGAWLRVEGLAVDWLYRDIGRVTSVIEDCRRGHVSCDYYLGHPHGFHNHIYMGEVAYGLPLEDPGNTLAALKVLTAQYPPAMRTAIISTYLYDARFMLELGRKSAVRGDVMHLAGCLFRVVAGMVQVLFALNERYFVNEKGSVRAVDEMPLKPARWLSTTNAVLGNPGTTPTALTRSLERTDRLLLAVEALAERESAA